MEANLPPESPEIGLVGCGRWGKLILRDLVSLGAKVDVMVRSKEGIQNAHRFGARNIVNDVASLSHSLHGYVVASITSKHHEVVKQLVHRGKPIYVEKPYCTDPEEILEIIEFHPNLVYVMHKWRYHPAIQKIREIADSGHLGKIRHINTRRNQWWTPHKDVDTVWIHYPHDLSIIWHLLDYLPPVTSSFIIRDVHGKIQGMTACLGDDVQCTLEHNIGYIVKDRALNVQFENGVVAMLDPLSDHLLSRKGQPREQLPVEKIPISTEMPLLRELSHFLKHVKDRQHPLLTPISEELVIAEKIAELFRMANQ